MKPGLTLPVVCSGKDGADRVSRLWSGLHWTAARILRELRSPRSSLCFLPEEETWKAAQAADSQDSGFFVRRWTS